MISKKTTMTEEEEQKAEPLVAVGIDALESEKRPVRSVYHGLNPVEHDERYGRSTGEAAAASKHGHFLRRRRRSVLSQLTASAFKRWLLRRVPVVDALRTYRLKAWIVGDIVAGLSVAVVTVPQCLGYAKLADVPAILGLYTSFFPVLVYFVFGSSRHVSIGTMAFCSLVVAEAIRKQGLNRPESPRHDNGTNDTMMGASDSVFTSEELEKIAVVVSVSFLAGVFQVLMSVFRLGILVSFMAEAFISGYMAAGALRITTIQIRNMFGLPPISGYSGPGEYFYSVFVMLRSLPEANLFEVFISVSSVVTLVVVKTCVNERFASRIKVPIPVDFIVVVIFTTASHFGQFEEKFGVEILKTVPKGIPAVTLPSMGIMSSCVFDAFMLAVVAYMTLGMMAKMLSQRHNYSVDNDQELLANGLSALGGAFFCSIAPSASPPRTLLMESSGGRTQVAYVVSSVVVLLTMAVFAPLFQPLPVCVLCSIIFVACFPLFPNFLAWSQYRKTSSYDLAIWAVSISMNLIFPLDTGLLIGMGFSLVLVHIRMQKPNTSRLAINDEDVIFLDEKQYSKSRSMKNLSIFRFESPLYFATLEVFVEELYKHTVSLSSLKSRMTDMMTVQQVPAPIPGTITDGSTSAAEEENSKCSKTEVDMEKTSANENNGGDADRNVVHLNHDDRHIIKKEGIAVDFRCELEQNFKIIVVDCSAIPFLDTGGAKTLGRLHGEYSQFNVRFLLANCCSGVLDQLRRVDQCKNLIAESVYPSIQDIIVIFGN